jgi:hypothetical protein
MMVWGEARRGNRKERNRDINIRRFMAASEKRNKYVSNIIHNYGFVK